MRLRFSFLAPNTAPIMSSAMDSLGPGISLKGLASSSRPPLTVAVKDKDLTWSLLPGSRTGPLKSVALAC